MSELQASWLSSEQSEPVKTGGDFFKPADGVTTIRIVSGVTAFYTVWDKSEGEPVKHVSRIEADLEAMATKDDKVKLTWGVVVWDHSNGELLPWEITQVSIINALITFNNAKMNPLTFDINILKSGEKLKTKYTLQPMNPAPLDALALDIVQSVTVNPEGFLDGSTIVS